MVKKLILERNLEARCVALAEKSGCMMPKWQNNTNKGMPDRILIAPGAVRFIEFKRPDGTQTPEDKRTKLQKVVHRKIHNTFGDATEQLVRTFDDYDKFAEYLGELLRETFDTLGFRQSGTMHVSADVPFNGGRNPAALARKKATDAVGQRRRRAKEREDRKAGKA